MMAAWTGRTRMPGKMTKKNCLPYPLTKMYKLTKFQVLEPEDKYRQAYRYELEFTRTKSYLFGLITKTHVP
jgi:hypothetical protein